MGRLASDAEWLQRVVGVDRVAVAAIADALRAARAAEMLVFTRWVLVMTNFERSLYADPESDLDARWWELVERYQLVRAAARAQRPGLGREDPRRLRARLLPHVSLRPHRRVAARGDARARVRRARRSARGRAACSRERVFAPGLSVRWDRLIEQATGEPLSAVALRPRHRCRLSGRSDDGPRTTSTTSASSPRPRGVEALLRRRARARAAARRPNFGFPVVWLRAGDCQIHLFERPGRPAAARPLRARDRRVHARLPPHEGARRARPRTFGEAMYELPDGGVQMYVRDPAGNLVELDHRDASTIPRDEVPEYTRLADRQPAGRATRRARRSGMRQAGRPPPL